MPKKFTDCVKNKGRVITIKPGKSPQTKGIYFHVCYPKGGGPAIRGEMKRSKKKG